MQDDMFFLPFLFTVVVQNATSQSDSNNSKNILPIVVLHGIASNAEAMAPFSDWLAEIYQRPVYNIEVGNGATTSLRRPMQFQLELLCDTIYSTKELENGFDFVGMSQGGLLARGYVEECNRYPVRNLITLVSPHGGVFFPDIKMDFYTTLAQLSISVSSYWRDPNRLADYYNECWYLPELNNEVHSTKAQEYRTKIKALNNFVMIWSPEDTTLNPPASGKFSFLSDNLTVIPLQETELYREDWLGLRYLAENKKLHMLETNCSHVDHRNAECFNQLDPLLRPFLGG